MDCEIKEEPLDHYEITPTPDNKLIIYQCDECQEEFAEKAILTLHKSLHDISKTCSVCKREYRDMQMFFNHINKHILEAFRCVLCPEVFFVKKEYNKHALVHESVQDNELQCKICKKTLTTKKGLTVHLRLHNNERPYSCNICSKTFTQSSSLITHKNTHLKLKQYNCEMCDGAFSTPSAVRRHIRTVHSKLMLLKCSFCQQTFSYKDALTNHVREVHADDTFNCWICASTYVSQKGLSTHIKQNHKLEKSFPCTQYKCRRKFFTKEHLLEHQAAEHTEVICNLSDESDTNDQIQLKIGSGTKSCPLCGEVFPYNSKYFRHKQTHETSCWCCVCKQFVEGPKILNHELEHLKMSIQEYDTCVATGIYPCKYCDHVEHKSFIRIKKHIRNHVVNLRTCNICHKSFTNAGAHSRHQYAKHKILECSICKLSLMGYHKYVKHRVTQHLNVKHKCDICSATFNNYVDWKRHKYAFHKVVQCYLCNVKFHGYYSYVSHRKKVHLSLLPKTFKCVVCNTGFLYKNLLKAHLERHVKRRSYRCVDCNFTNFHMKKFEEHFKSSLNCTSQKFTTTKLLTNIHIKAEEKPYTNKHLSLIVSNNDKKCRFECKNCLRKFRFLWNWRKHVQLKRCLKPTEQDLNDFNCAVCDAVHEDMSSLVQHMMKHTQFRKTPVKLVGEKRRVLLQKKKIKRENREVKTTLMEKDTLRTEILIKDEVDPEC